MKTLTQVEPRTLIAAVPYYITNSGSYYLTGNVGSNGQDGIVIRVSGVTVDLNGFSVIGSTIGISAPVSGLSDVIIRNGTVARCSGPGIDLSSVRKCQIEHVLVCDNGGIGMSVGSASIIDLCTASGNTGSGIGANESSAVFNCISQSNKVDGIVVTSQCRVSENLCDGNGNTAATCGIHATGRANRIEANNVSRNTGLGVRVDGSETLVIKNSACANTVADYQIAAGNNYGQILTGPGAGFINSNPWANFSCASPSGGTCLSDLDCAASGNQCNNGVCVAGRCQTNPKAAGTACDDGLYCTFSEVCNGMGQCSGGTVRSCDDGNACTVDTCDNTLQSCLHSNVANGTACPGGTCNNGVCQGTACTTNASCDDGNACTTDVCTAGVCSHNPVANGTACPGGTCNNGACQAAASCTDGIKNGTETGVDCGGANMCPRCGVGITCSASSDCQSGVCQNGFCQASGACTTDGNCTTGQYCSGGNCVPKKPDGQVCTGSNECSSGVCQSGVCQAQCPAGMVNCGGVCRNTSTDPINCGACGNVCARANATPSCVSGQCSIGSCNVGFADCNGNSIDGCESNISTSTINCGSCGRVCSSNHIVTTSCSGGVCNGACTAGFADCNGNRQIDGCETSTTNDRNNCGGCGIVCSGVLNCVNSVCQ